MYRCCVHFYLVGWEKQDAELVKGIPPLESFSHVFAESPRPEQELAAAADVILADLRKLDAVETVSSLAAARREGSQLIALAEAEQFVPLSPFLPQLQDIWTAPLSAPALQFRFQRWLEGYKQSKDLWQTDQFLEAVINGAPNMVWFKDKTASMKR